MSLEGAEKWQSAMTCKFVGALRGITGEQPHVMKALQLGILLGLGIEILRKLVKKSRRYQEFVKRSRAGFATDFTVDSFIGVPDLTRFFSGDLDDLCLFNRALTAAEIGRLALSLPGASGFWGLKTHDPASQPPTPLFWFDENGGDYRELTARFPLPY